MTLAGGGGVDFDGEFAGGEIWNIKSQNHDADRINTTFEGTDQRTDQGMIPGFCLEVRLRFCWDEAEES